MAGNKSRILLIVLLFDIAQNEAKSLCSEEHGWKVVMEDNFTSGELNTTLWTARKGPDGTVYFSAYNVDTSSGQLVLETRREEFMGANYTSGQVQSMMAFQFGRFCVTARLPKSRPGVLPQHFLATSGSDCHEDIYLMQMTNGSGVMQGSTHYLYSISSTTPCSGDVLSCQGEVIDTNFTEAHEYGVDWSPSELTFYLDGRAYLTCFPQSSNASRPALASNLQMTLDTMIDQDVSDTTLLPAEHIISSVKVVQREEDAWMRRTVE